MSILDDLEAKLAAATPGPWEVGDRFAEAGVLERIYGPGKCTYCDMPLLWEGMSNINGKLMQVHLHERTARFSGDGHEINAYHGEDRITCVAGNYDYEEGGICDPKDTALIVAAVNNLPALLTGVRLLREWCEICERTEWNEANSIGDLLTRSQDALLALEAQS